MFFRHSEAFLFIRFSPTLSLQHHAPRTLSHRPSVSFHSTPSVPLIPLIHSAPPGLPAAPLRPPCLLPSLHCRFPDPLLSLRLFIPLSSPRSASSIHSTPSISSDTLSGHGCIPSQSIPDRNTVKQLYSNLSKKNKKRRGEDGESKPTGQNAHNVAPVSRLFNISERSCGNPMYNVATSHPQFFPSARCTTVAKPSSAPPGVCEKGRAIAGICEQVSPGPSWPWRSLPPHRLWRSPSERRPTRPRLR